MLCIKLNTDIHFLQLPFHIIISLSEISTMKLLVLFTKPISTTTTYDQDPNLIFTVVKYAQLNNIFFIYWNDKYIHIYIILF